MKLTIGTTSYNNLTEVYYTIQSLRMYHDLTDCEILVIDNYGDNELESFIKSNGDGVVRYVKCLDGSGPAYAKNQVFEHAKGEMVLCIDSHVLLAPGALVNFPITDDLISGPMMYNNHKNYTCSFNKMWRGNMWGVWSDAVDKNNLPKSPIDIWGMGCGAFATRKSTWLKFNEKFRGFGSEEGYIHEKYRQAGRKVQCYPQLIWEHQFTRKIPYPVNLIDRVRNYIIGFEELKLDPTEMEAHFGLELIKQAKDILVKETLAPHKITVNTDKKISCLCITYGRPHCVEEAIHSFLRQDYSNKELIIVNDLPEQTLIFNHPEVKIYNYKERFIDIVTKRNKAAELATGEILCNWDDDDLSLPWRLSQVAKVFSDYPEAGYFKADKGWCIYGDEGLKKPHHNMWYMTAAFTKKAFTEVDGYKVNVGDDIDICERLIKHLGPDKAKTLSFPDEEYAFIYNWRQDILHLSVLLANNPNSSWGDTESHIKSKPIQAIVHLVPHWREDYLEDTRKLLKS